MTPPQAAASLQRKADNSRTVVLDAGHSLMTEAPDGVLDAIKGALSV